MPQYSQGGQRTIGRSQFSPCTMLCLGDWTHVIRVRGRYLYSLIHLTGPTLKGITVCLFCVGTCVLGAETSCARTRVEVRGHFSGVESLLETLWNSTPVRPRGSHIYSLSHLSSLPFYYLNLEYLAYKSGSQETTRQGHFPYGYWELFTTGQADLLR